MNQSAPKFATFDLEIARAFPDNGNWDGVTSLGITCAAIGFSDAAEPTFFHAAPELTRNASIELVRALERVRATAIHWSRGTARRLILPSSRKNRRCRANARNSRSRTWT